jgi:hypothetical protein
LEQKIPVGLQQVPEENRVAQFADSVIAFPRAPKKIDQ